jgi:acetyltransferase-like isoleucine patch superfamily enzyme
MFKLLLATYRRIRTEVQLRKDPLRYFRGLGVRIGEGTRFFGADAFMFGSEPYLVQVGRGCFITNGVKFITHDGAALLFRDRYPDLDLVAPIRIGNGVFIGSSAIIMPGVTIGDRCIVGAGSIVTRSVEEGSVIAGVPAKRLKSTEEYLEAALARTVGTKRMSPKEKREFLERKFNSD